MSSAAVAELVDVHKTFATGVTALAGVSLRLAAGEWVSLLGPSGCGKSTVLRLLAGLDTATSGDVQRPRAAERGRSPAAFVFQDPTLLPWATVTDNVRLPLRITGQADPAAVAAALARVGLADFARAYPRELSGGMRMRVSLARALVTRPRLMLLDEPFAALDEITRLDLNDEVLGLWATGGWSTVFVTHSVVESVYLSDRVIVMTPRPGRVHQEIVIDLPRPRGEATRLDPRYAALCAEASAALHAAMRGGEVVR